MQAAVVFDPSIPPAYASFADPVPSVDEVLVTVSCAAQSTLAKAQAAGNHYSSTTKLPFIPGVDGVGRLTDGTRVYFAFPRAPYGSMAQKAAIPHDFCVALPDDLSDDLAAASANPGMSSWAALTERARLQPGETVLVNGATGVSGRLAVQIAKHLGASRVIATGRNAAAFDELRTLGADATISLAAPHEELVETLRDEIRASNVNVILDYLWGEPAAALIDALSGNGSAEAEPLIRFIQIGSSAGPEITLNAKYLRSSGLELIGSGLGSISYKKLVAATGTFLQNIIPSGFRIATRLAPLVEVSAMWDQPLEDRRRLVFRI
jgi:NADPH:quinone reductase-like Zn-dependent oxidoreductase